MWDRVQDREPSPDLFGNFGIDFFDLCAYNIINRTPRTSQRCAPGETFFYTEIFMSEVKPYLSYEGQINKLREKGCIIADDSFCESILVNIGYYRLSAYFLPFKNKNG